MRLHHSVILPYRLCQSIFFLDKFWIYIIILNHMSSKGKFNNRCDHIFLLLFFFAKKIELGRRENLVSNNVVHFELFFS